MSHRGKLLGRKVSIQCNAIVISKTRVRSEAFQGQPFRVSLVGKGRLGGNAMMMRPSKETSVLAKIIKGRKEATRSTTWERNVLKRHLNLDLYSCCKSRFRALRVRATKLTHATPEWRSMREPPAKKILLTEHVIRGKQTPAVSLGREIAQRLELPND